MSRAAPTALFTGIAAAVVGLSKIHASQVGTYDYSGSSRFAWSLAYVAILAVAAYGMGLPDVPRSRRTAVISVQVERHVKSPTVTTSVEVSPPFSGSCISGPK